MKKNFSWGFVVCFTVFVLLNITFLFSAKITYVSAIDVNAEDELVYVSLGDSIAAGHSLSGHSINNQYGMEGKTSTQIVDGSYTQLFRDNVLKANYENVKTISYAKSGQTSTDLLNNLKNDENIKESVKKADIITVCIGANDILSVLNADDVAFSVAMYLADINDNIISDFEEGIKTCINNYPKIIETLNELNPNAKILFQTVFPKIN